MAGNRIVLAGKRTLLAGKQTLLAGKRTLLAGKRTVEITPFWLGIETLSPAKPTRAQ